MNLHIRADALFLAFNVDLEKKETHCHEAVEAASSILLSLYERDY